MSLSVIILAAGKGTRMCSALPKVLHPVLSRPMIGHVVGAARALGAERIVVVVGHGREQVEAYLTQHEGGPDLEFVLQAEQRGTGHAVLQAREALEGQAGDTLILSGDVPNLTVNTLDAFCEAAGRAKGPMAVMTCELGDPTGYGRIERAASGAVTRIVEHRDATPEQRAIREINAGIYLVDNGFLWQSVGELTTDNAQGEYYLTDLVEVASRGEGASAFMVSEATEVQGVNTRAELARAEARARWARNHALMVAGVTMIDPATTYVDAWVEVEPDVLLEPGVRLTGRTRVEAGCVVRQGSVIEDSMVEAGAVIKPYCHLESAIVRRGAQVGPFAHLRQASDIGEGAKIGNFVEVKKSVIGAGSKASHLTYLGDAKVGVGCNIGAGTITCNYDGEHKHQTTLGDGVFIGSNTALVAPIELGDRAYVGAGSTLTQDVAEGSLSVARGRQRNIAGWADRRRKKT
ncbi:MAG: UDP-N-acetylglucosamine diphosphorylase/glucosamine-1-phosphate N-acetyltransferase [Myxococcales bacterium]|nr:UDP-N-acetylglucosamine diphosphorylase/glucosamine-1-phosphate N-acetyltransferase [Myxococcales bacterium]